MKSKKRASKTELHYDHKGLRNALIIVLILIFILIIYILTMFREEKSLFSPECLLQDANLKLYLNFNNGTALDESPANLQGNVTGAIWTSAGKFGGAFDFDGDNDYIQFNDPTRFDFGAKADKSYTIVAWINLDGWGHAGTGRIVNFADGAEGLHGYVFFVKDNVRDIRIRHNNLTVFSGNDFTINLTTWHHVAVVYDSTQATATFYVDGIEQGIRAGVFPPGNGSTNPLTIGIRSDNLQSDFNGRIDELFIFDRPLGAGEITKIFINDVCTPLCAPDPAGEICGDSVDNDCDTIIDENCQTINCIDNDNDYFNQSAAGCGIADCDDIDAEINPSAMEICEDGIDNDCSNGDIICQNNSTLMNQTQANNSQTNITSNNMTSTNQTQPQTNQPTPPPTQNQQQISRASMPYRIELEPDGITLVEAEDRREAIISIGQEEYHIKFFIEKGIIRIETQFGNYPVLEKEITSLPLGSKEIFVGIKSSESTTTQLAFGLKENLVRAEIEEKKSYVNFQMYTIALLIFLMLLAIILAIVYFSKRKRKPIQKEKSERYFKVESKSSFS